MSKFQTGGLHGGGCWVAAVLMGLSCAFAQAQGSRVERSQSQASDAVNFSELAARGSTGAAGGNGGRVAGVPPRRSAGPRTRAFADALTAAPVSQTDGAAGLTGSSAPDLLFTAAAAPPSPP